MIQPTGEWDGTSSSIPPREHSWWHYLHRTPPTWSRYYPEELAEAQAKKEAIETELEKMKGPEPLEGV